MPASSSHSGPSSSVSFLIAENSRRRYARQRALWFTMAGLGLFGLSLGAAAAAPNKSPAGTLLQSLKQKLAEEAFGTLLDNQLPLKLDADASFPTVPMLPGGPFNPRPLQLTADLMRTPLPPGDYVIRAWAFCSEYSVHRSGAGAAYQLAPIQGKAADAIAMLLWRGPVEKGLSPRRLQAVSFAIQSGITYAKMPALYRSVIDDVIPEFRGQLSGDFVQSLEDLYQNHAKDAGLPPLPELLASLGKPGELVLSANQQRKILLRKDTSDQLKDQILYAGQERRIAPESAVAGPWTVRIPGVAYVRYRVVGGNMKSTNEIQIRIVPPPEAKLVLVPGTWAIFASYRAPQEPVRVAARAAAPTNPTLFDLVGRTIGYPRSRGAQALVFTPVVTPASPPPVEGAAGQAKEIKGAVTLTHNGETGPLALNGPIHMGDTLTTGPDGGLFATFADGTQLQLGPNTTTTVDEYLYDSTEILGGSSAFDWIRGTFIYTSGLIGKSDDGSGDNRSITTPVGGVGIRGTEFIAKYDAKVGNVAIQLISGSLAISPKDAEKTTTVKAPVSITFDATRIRTGRLTRRQYDATKRAWFTPASVPPQIQR